MIVNVTDPKYFEVGYGTSNYKPGVHRLIFENGQVFGADNLVSTFKDDKGHFNHNEWSMFLQLVSTLPTGSYNDLTWEQE